MDHSNNALLYKSYLWFVIPDPKNNNNEYFYILPQSAFPSDRILYSSLWSYRYSTHYRYVCFSLTHWAYLFDDLLSYLYFDNIIIVYTCMCIFYMSLSNSTSCSFRVWNVLSKIILTNTVPSCPEIWISVGTKRCLNYSISYENDTCEKLGIQ